MKISFDTYKLEKVFKDFNKCKRAFGDKRAKLIFARIAAFNAAESFEDLREMPGRYHELKSPRKGQWACDLDHPYRLIFTPTHRPIPVDNDGFYIWSEIFEVKLIEIIDYH